jgi:hypothetical protein
MANKEMISEPKLGSWCTVVIPRTVTTQGNTRGTTVESAGSGLCFLQNSAKPYATNGVNLANGVADIRSHVPFKVWVISTFDRPHTLQKGMVLGWTIPHPIQILTVPTGDDRKDGNIIGRGAPDNSLFLEQTTPEGQHPDVIGQCSATEFHPTVQVFRAFSLHFRRYGF